MMELYLIRHGQTSDNSRKYISGAPATPLSPHGEAQVQELRTYLLKTEILKNVKSAYTTSALRAIQSASILLPELNVQTDDRLLEIHSGDFCCQTWEDYYLANPTLRGKRLSEISFPNGESYRDLYSRTKAMLQELEDKNESSVIVAHGGSIVCALYHLLDLPFESYSSFIIDNASITALSYEHGNWMARFINFKPF